MGNRSSTVPTCKRLSEGRTICCSSGACTGCCHTAEKAHALSSTMMTTRDALKECTRSRTGLLSLERWRVKFRTMRMEEAPPIRVQVKNVLGASAVRSCAAEGAGSTYAAGACSSGSPACPTGACLERSPNSCTTRVKLSQLRVFHCSARCVESTCLFRLGGIRD